MKVRNVAATLAVCLLLAPIALAADEAEDPWTGKTRDELIELLGKPDKQKTDKSGVEKLTYRFRRIDPAAPPHPDAKLVQVPGIGVLVKLASGTDRPPKATAIEPPTFDDQGRPTGGGATPTRSASATYDPKSKQTSRTTTEEENPPGGGKVKLRFTLDAAGRVSEWSSSGAK